MAVVFDQVLGNVIPETEATQREQETTPMPLALEKEKLCQLIKRREQRLARLRAH